jgi:hypothetical protein
MSPETLSQLRARLPGCDLLIYADIGSRTVLASSGRLSMPQEVLDALTDCAAELLSLPPESGDGTVEQTLLLTPTGVRGFLRAPGEAAEALCWLGAPDADLRRITSDLAAALAAAPTDTEDG